MRPVREDTIIERRKKRVILKEDEYKGLRNVSKEVRANSSLYVCSTARARSSLHVCATTLGLKCVYVCLYTQVVYTYVQLLSALLLWATS